MTAADVPAPGLTVDEARFVSRPAVDIAADVREEEVARALCDAEADRGDGPRWTWDELTVEGSQSDYRRMARAALAAARPPAPADADDTAAAVEYPDPCHSRGPRIGSEGQPLCGLPLGHTGAHRPDPEDGWGTVSWGGPR